MLPRDISQLVFNKFVSSQKLTDVSLEAFRDCALQVPTFFKEKWLFIGKKKKVIFSKLYVLDLAGS